MDISPLKPGEGAFAPSLSIVYSLLKELLEVEIIRIRADPLIPVETID
jgi:hypothetical protein